MKKKCFVQCFNKSFQGITRSTPKILLPSRSTLQLLLNSNHGVSCNTIYGIFQNKSSKYEITMECKLEQKNLHDI
mgnify:CR=1 FL=1